MDSSRFEAGDGAPDSHPATLPPVRLPQHGTTRYLRVEFEVEDGVVRWVTPRTILGIVPIGTRRIEVPIEGVGALRLRRVVHPVRLVVGAACILVPPALALWWAAVPLAVFGLWVILVSVGPHLEMVTSAGTKHRAAVCFGHQIDAELYVDAVGGFAAEARRSASAGSGD